MTPEEKQILIQAKAQIQKREFAAARHLLEQIPFNETADKWLKKLDEIAPAASPKTNKAEPVYVAPSLLPDEAPLNPRQLGGWKRYSIPFWSWWRLSRNWRRLGRPNYVAETMLGGVFLFVLMIAVLVVIGVVFRGIPVYVATGGLIALGLAVRGYEIFISEVQYSGYKVWITTSNYQALLDHRYPWGRGFMMYGGIIFLITVGISGFTFYQLRPHEIRTDLLVLTAPGGWDSIKSLDDYGYCEGYQLGCHVVLSNNNGEAVAIVQWVGYEDYTLEAAHEEDWQWRVEAYNLEFRTRFERQIAGQRAICTEYLDTADNETYYTRLCHIFYNHTLYEITGWSYSESEFKRLQASFDSIYDSIRFHNQVTL